jgi:hypothetical protein
MVKQIMTLDEALTATSGLSALDKVRLMERLAAMLENDLAAGKSPELLDDSPPQRMTFKELAAWLDANPPEEPWGDLKDDEDAGEYVHRMRRQSTIWLDEPGEKE